MPPARWRICGGECNPVAPRSVREHLVTVPGDSDVVSEAPLLVEHAGAHGAQADLCRMRHARGRSQGLVLYPSRARGDGAAKGREAVGGPVPHPTPVRRRATSRQR